MSVNDFVFSAKVTPSKEITLFEDLDAFKAAATAMRSQVASLSESGNFQGSSHIVAEWVHVYNANKPILGCCHS